MATDDKGTDSIALKVRAFRPSDVVSISEILRDSTEAAQWPSESHAKLAATPGGVFLVCETITRLVGFLAARQVADEAEILNIAVYCDFRRKGVASTLLLAALDNFRRSAITRVFLELRESNQPARALYERHGFVPAGIRKSYYRDPTEHALCMQKKLTDPSH
ncbi:MAG: rimI [Candidatus Acidoferrum typicum]|nr:rimI [Candidatus Acidoferrum typicum]